MLMCSQIRLQSKDTIDGLDLYLISANNEKTAVVIEPMKTNTIHALADIIVKN